MIIVEGPDGSGKSTLAKKIGKNVLHSGGPITDRAEIFNRVKNLSEQYREGDVVDRFPYLSEIVYGQPPIIAPVLLISAFEAFRERCNRMTLIYCRAEIQTMYENISYEKKTHKSESYLEEVKKRYFEIVQKYDELFNTIKPDFIYNWQKDKLPCVD